MTVSNMITGIPLHSLGCSGARLLAARKSTSAHKHHTYPSFCRRANDCWLEAGTGLERSGSGSERSDAGAGGGRHSPAVRQTSFDSQHNGIDSAKMGTRVAAATSTTMAGKNKQSNRNRKQNFFLMRQNGILKIRFLNVCLVRLSKLHSIVKLSTARRGTK